MKQTISPVARKRTSTASPLPGRNVALAHHWIMSYRGGERVLEQFAAMFPESDIYTLVRDPGVDVPGIRGRRIHTSRLDRWYATRKRYQHLLPLHPWAIDRMRVAEQTELLISSDSALVKGLRIPQHAKHVCYCHSPPRYLWEMGETYKKRSLAARVALDWFADGLRDYDFRAAARVNHFVANSRFVADRILNYYGRPSDVIHPPVAVHEFSAGVDRADFDLVVSELTPYKRIDLAVHAYTRLRRPLVIIGDGGERKYLESIAGPSIRFLGRQPFENVRSHFERCRAFVFPGIEDFGITPVEAQAAGAAVIARGAGGALETVVADRTGVFFDTDDVESLCAAVKGFRRDDFSPQVCRQNAERFSTPRFLWEMTQFLQRKLEPGAAAAARIDRGSPAANGGMTGRRDPARSVPLPATRPTGTRPNGPHPTGLRPSVVRSTAVHPDATQTGAGGVQV
ncbi:MAG: glycosyltransferase [Planctomycetota bacterium]